MRDKLPHPLNMVATHEKGETYTPSLPDFADTTKYDLIRGFTEDRDVARGMILTYLGGTAKWKVEEVKEKIKSEGKVANFRTKESQAIRDKRLPKQVNYLNCAYRYRGKANYRDSIFLPYGEPHSWLDAEYIRSLFVAASFSFLCATAFAEKRIGKKRVREFASDIALHLRGRQDSVGLERLWEDVVSFYPAKQRG